MNTKSTTGTREKRTLTKLNKHDNGIFDDTKYKKDTQQIIISTQDSREEAENMTTEGKPMQERKEKEADTSIVTTSEKIKTEKNSTDIETSLTKAMGQ